jgi:hypothetical protein
MDQMDDDMSLILSSLPVCDSGSQSIVPGRSLMPLDRVVTEAVPPRARGGKRIVQFSAMAVLFAAHPCSCSISSIWILGLHFRLRYVADISHPIAPAKLLAPQQILPSNGWWNVDSSEVGTINQHLQPEPRAAGFQGMVIGFSTGIMEKIISGRTNLKSSSACGFRIFLRYPAEVYGEMKAC